MGESLDRYTFDDDGRVYTNHDDLWLPSVSTVLSVRPKGKGLKNWLSRTSEAEQNQKKFYTSNRGTLIHYHLLTQLVDEEFWSDDEETSERELKGLRENEETGLTGDQETYDRFIADREWANETWQLIRRIYGIHPENTLDVELFVSNTDVGYAGQFDLLYVDGDGDVVLGDIKTSKRVYDKHQIQLSSYAEAVDIAVDRLEVFRINPDQQTWTVSKSTDWLEDRDTLFDEFCDLRAQLDDDRITGLKDRVQSNTDA